VRDDEVDDGTPRAALDAAGRGVGAFAHRSGQGFGRSGDGVVEVYGCLGGLSYLVGALPQVLHTLMSAVRAQQELGVLTVPGAPKGADVLATVEAVSVAVELGMQAAYRLREQVDAAHELVAGLGQVRPGAGSAGE